MPVTDVTTDPQERTLTLTADFEAPVERVWDAFTDPAQLERFWGPPGYPATFTAFDLTVGGHARYHMTSPKQEKSYGDWEFLSIDGPRSLTFLDAFVDADGTVFDGFPAMRAEFTFEATATGTRFTNVSHFDSADALEQAVDMGAAEGYRQAIDQLDVVLQDLRDYAQGKGTNVELVDDTHVRITRLVEGPRELVWRAHNDPELMKQWLLGPDGWEMTECIVATEVGQTYRNSWAPVGDTEGEPFGFEGEALVIDAPRRSVQTERMIGMPVETLNDLNLYEEDGATLITLFIEYPDKETRDMILATGMADGMEASYARLEQELLTV
jgi:uncharacterized protein YndB with AHSA1/START domain